MSTETASDSENSRGHGDQAELLRAQMHKAAEEATP